MPNWITELGIPIFMSRRRLERQKSMPRASAPWALDSGGFTEVALGGGWRLGPRVYARRVRRYADEIGLMSWASPQDWMCEPVALKATGLDVAEHQRRTVENFLTLRDIADDLPFVPVLQGWERDDYLRHVDAYAAAGIDLAAEPIVGVGTVCRRQETVEAENIFAALHERGLALHGFGVKTTGLLRYAELLASADSMAWSYNARRHPPLEGCTHMHCGNCPRWALRWRERLLTKLSYAA